MPQGEITGTPKESRLQVFTYLTGKTNEIPFDLIDAVAVGDERLPPIARFRKGLPSELKNEVEIKGGEYMQGDETGIDDEQPVHRVTVSSFAIDATEVTRTQFGAFTGDTGYKTATEKRENKQTWKTPGFEHSHTDPAVYLSWLDAAHYCNWRSEKCGLTPCYTFSKGGEVETDRTADGYRLPTEAEWEYAARSGGKDRVFACGYDKDGSLLANAKDTSAADPWIWSNPVEYFPPNDAGIYGMSGNVWEWCEDWYFNRAYLQHRRKTNPCVTHKSAPGLTRRVMRGGSYRNGSDLLRCSSRGNGLPYASAPHVGFRCVRNLEE